MSTLYNISLGGYYISYPHTVSHMADIYIGCQTKILAESYLYVTVFNKSSSTVFHLTAISCHFLLLLCHMYGWSAEWAMLI